MIRPRHFGLALILLNTSVFSSVAYSQDAHTAIVNSAGGTHSTDQFTLDWSVGELVRIDTRFSENKALILTQGLLQPDLGRQLILVTEPTFAPGEIRILPNPVRSILQVQFGGRHAGYIRCMLYDNKGVRMGQAGFQYYGHGYTQSFNMSKLAAGQYYLYVELEPVVGSQVRKGGYKIIKLN